MNLEWKLTKGPWDGEPDRLEFRSHGFACLAKRNMVMGFWCGYVGLPPEHPLYGKDYNQVEETHDIRVHGGLTYSALCNEAIGICHKPAPGEPEDLFWLGFDCAHGGDLEPAIRALGFGFHAVYRDLEYVKQECEQLADQLEKVKG